MHQLAQKLGRTGRPRCEAESTVGPSRLAWLNSGICFPISAAGIAPGSRPKPSNGAATSGSTRAEVSYTGRGTGRLATALRNYPNSQDPIATPAVRSTLGEDLYVTLMAYDRTTDEVTLRIFVNPLVSWIWIGGGIVALGSVFAIWPDRRLAHALDRAGTRPRRATAERRAVLALEAAVADRERS